MTSESDGMADEDGSSSEEQDGVLEAIDRMPLSEGFLAGVGSFVLGYVLFFITSVTTADSIEFSDPAELLRDIGILFYNSHFIPRHVEGAVVLEPESGDEVEVEPIAVPIDETRNLLLDGSQTLPTAVYFLIPIVALLAVAIFAHRRYVPGSGLGPQTLLFVVGLWIGYLVMALAGSYALAYEVSGATEDFDVFVDRVDVLLYGSLYPLAVGLFGSLLVDVTGLDRGGGETGSVTGLTADSESSDMAESETDSTPETDTRRQSERDQKS